MANDGGVLSYGDATFEGSAGGLPINTPMVRIGVAHCATHPTRWNNEGRPSGPALVRSGRAAGI